MTDDDLYRLLVVRGYPQHEAANIAAGPHPVKQPDEPCGDAVLHDALLTIANGPPRTMDNSEVAAWASWIAMQAMAGRLPSGWQPIETAPTDGRWILGAHAGSNQAAIIKRSSGEWIDQDHGIRNPSIWAPLPKPPMQPPTKVEK